MSPSAEPSWLSSHCVEPAAHTTSETQPGAFEKAWRENVHSKWEKLCAATAKCDICQLQGREVLQKCSSCTWSICRKCSAAITGSQKNKTHKLDDNSVDWDAPPKKNATHAKKMSTKRAKRIKTADKLQRSLALITEEFPASGINIQAKSQAPPLRGIAHKAIQTMPEMFAARRDFDIFVDGEDENAAGILTRMQRLSRSSPDDQQNPVTSMVSFVPAQILEPHPSTCRYLPRPYQSGNPFQLQHPTAPSSITHGHFREPSSSRIKLLPLPTNRHHHRPSTPIPDRTRNHQPPGHCEIVQNWLPPLVNCWSHNEENINRAAFYNGPCAHDRYAEPLRSDAHDKGDYRKQSCPESGPPKSYETVGCTRQEITETRICEEALSRAQPAPEHRTTVPRDLASPRQTHKETESVLGKHGRSKSRPPTLEAN